jgi:hypothetical protein
VRDRHALLNAARCVSAALASVVLTATCAVAQTPPFKAGVVAVVDGPVTVLHARLPSVIPLKYADDLFLGDLVSTGEGARVVMVLVGYLKVELSERSALRITEVPNAVLLDLQAGQLVANVAVRPWPHTIVRTTNADVSVIGARHVIVAVEKGGDFVQTHVDVVDGKVSVMGSSVGNTAVPRTVVVGSNEGVTVTRDGSILRRPLRSPTPK